MNSTEYRAVMMAVHSLRQAARAVPLTVYDEALAAIDTADAVGPAFDATLYRQQHEAMAQDRAVIAKARELAALGS